MRLLALATWIAVSISWSLPPWLSLSQDKGFLQSPIDTSERNTPNDSSGGGNSHHDRLGAVACENKVCSQIGVDLLTAGGNAADALVGTVFCIGVLDSHHSGPGGGGFALARSSNGSYESIDFRESAPAAAYRSMYKDNVLGSIVGGLSSGVPGEMRGMQYIHDRYGSLSWLTVLQPAITLAEDGFVIGEDFDTAMDSVRDGSFFSEDPVWAEDFAPNGTRLAKGDLMTRRRYARMLKTIANEGADAFYTGPIGQDTITALQKSNGTMVLKDLQEYRVVSREPVSIDYNGVHVHSCGIPASGAVTLSALKILEGYNDSNTCTHELKVHRMDEAVRFGYGKRASFGDPDFVKGLAAFEAEMLSEGYAAATRDKILDYQTLNVSDYDPNGFEVLEDDGTSHVVTADASGMAFSLTTTINVFFGSKVMVPETGVITNNQMNDFSVPNISNVYGYYPSPANYIRAAKRPLTSISPLIVEHANKTLHSVFGASGGSRIITTTLQEALHILDNTMSVAEAVAQPRMHDQLIPNVARFDYAYDNATVESMRAKGHNVIWGLVGSSAQALAVRGGRFEAAGEPKQKDSGGLTA